MDPLVRINNVFSEATFAQYKKKKYGLKSCASLIDIDLADDLRVLLIRAKEMNACNCLLGNGCSLPKIEEKINTL